MVTSGKCMMYCVQAAVAWVATTKEACGTRLAMVVATVVVRVTAAVATAGRRAMAVAMTTVEATRLRAATDSLTRTVNSMVVVGLMLLIMEIVDS